VSFLLGVPLRIAAWIVMVLLSGVCLLHLFGSTSKYWEIAVLSMTPWLLLPAWPIGVIAGVRRHWMLFGICVVIVACQLVWVGPQFKPWSDAPTPGSGPRLSIFDANVSQANRNLGGIAAEIRATRPQIVALEELTPQAYSSLQSSGVMASFPYHLLRVQYGAGGVGLWSASPLSAASTWDNSNNQKELDATVSVGGHQIRIAVAHVYAPVGYGGPSLWHAQLARLAANLKNQPRPLVVAGDFNSTADLPEFRSVLDEGLSDTAVLVGKGWEMTWPRNQAWVLPYLRLDHVLVSRQLTVTGYRLGTGRGSDHKPVIVDIALAR
jgi:endonuclease/exonuclease/phosphatase (EEP) superfamily protein YafD